MNMACIHQYNIYMYFRQAFDSINRGKMLEDLLSLGIPLQKNWYVIEVSTVGSRAMIRVGSQFISTFPITTGIRQGDEHVFLQKQ